MKWCTRHSQQRHQVVGIVLIRLGVIGVADVATHRQPEQFAAEVIRARRAGSGLPSNRYSGPMKPTTVLTKQRFVSTGDCIGTRLEGLLIDPVVRVRRQSRTLAGLEVHHVLADRTPAEFPCSLLGLRQQAQVDSETAVGPQCRRSTGRPDPPAPLPRSP